MPYPWLSTLILLAEQCIDRRSGVLRHGGQTGNLTKPTKRRGFSFMAQPNRQRFQGLSGYQRA
jgi:hypothetical protein